MITEKTEHSARMRLSTGTVEGRRTPGLDACLTLTVANNHPGHRAIEAQANPDQLRVLAAYLIRQAGEIEEERKKADHLRIRHFSERHGNSPTRVFP
ncbi:hypothetical protein [Kitasatospora purpeofusca]|uniref:hypothetical protein n=1 Tax=Kitasatospora purpeofusca TaxID=67352 RepID=UPI0036A9B2B2